MFELQLDLKMYFCPPMDPDGSSIRLTRAVQLPFPPYSDLAIYSTAMETHPIPEGMPLKNVVWDIERQRFTAECTLEHHDLPFDYIGDEIASWVAIGWKLGSYLDDYGRDLEATQHFADDEESNISNGETATAENSTDCDPDEQMPTMLPRQRPKQFNKLFRALIRVICEDHRPNANAYAMWKSKRFFTEEQLKDNSSRPAQQFLTAKEEFSRMSFSEQFDWAARVCERLPRIERIVAEIGSETPDR